MTSLYICYQSLLDPLTQTQVVAYLEGLARAGYTIVLLTFERRPLSEVETKLHAARLKELGITWHWLRYHKRPTVPATAWDVLVGVIVGLRLIGKHNVKLVHARSHVPAVMGRALKLLTGVKLLFDIRGFMAEEYVDAGVWPAGGRLFRLAKRAERHLVKSADAIVVLTEKGRDLLRQWYGKRIEGKPLTVIPCCVDLRRMEEVAALELELAQVVAGEFRGAGGALREDDGLWGEGVNSPLRFVYVGKLDGWYLTEEMADFMAVSLAMISDLSWQVWTQSPSDRLQGLLTERGISEHVSIGQCSSDELADKLRRAHAGLSFIKPCVSKLASSPTKVGEYLAAGLPVIGNPGIGDLDRLLAGEGSEGGRGVGVLVNSFTTGGYREAVNQLQALLQDSETGDRCRRAATQKFDLVAVGWSRYRQLYDSLLREQHSG